MEQLGQFVVNHWSLWLSLAILLVLVLINELQTQQKRGKELSPQTAVHHINRDNAIVIDLRETEAFQQGHIIDSIRASADEFNQQHMNKYKEKPLILVCSKGLQSATLAKSLRNQGFTQPMVLAGGIAAWQAAELPLIKGK
jgi:rhodanese-related sulfurtransferase